MSQPLRSPIYTTYKINVNNLERGFMEQLIVDRDNNITLMVRTLHVSSKMTEDPGGVVVMIL
jgi:hypothetical protein